MEDKDKEQPSIRKCTKCKLPVKSHPGPVGDKCTVNSEQVREFEADVGAVGGHDTDHTISTTMSDILLRQMVEQMTNMNINITKILQNQSVTIDAKSHANPPSHHGPNLIPQVVTPQQHGQETPGNADRDTGIPAHVPPKIAASCQNGEYVNLYELLPHDTLPCNEMVATRNNDGTMSFQPKKFKKSLDNFDNWLSAWSVFEQLVVITKPTMYYKLSQYRQFIHRCDRKFLWHAVSTYDQRFRAKLSESKSFMYDTIDNMLYVSILDATAIRVDSKQCFRCKSLDHLVFDCPFPAQDKVGKDASQRKFPPNRYQPNQGNRQRQERTAWHDGREICNNWQYENCRFPNSCNRAHVCRSCKGNYPYFRCVVCNPGNAHTQSGLPRA